tara:strand:- start:5323 stop:5586 length:264 start_codon:yes stop_codon:yes gene_type:complete
MINTQTIREFQTRKDEAFRALCGLSSETVSYMSCYCYEKECDRNLVSFVSEVNTCIDMLYYCKDEQDLLELEDRVAKFDAMIKKYRI